MGWDGVFDGEMWFEEMRERGGGVFGGDGVRVSVKGAEKGVSDRGVISPFFFFKKNIFILQQRC